MEYFLTVRHASFRVRERLSPVRRQRIPVQSGGYQLCCINQTIKR
ncbi:hypothetical protein [Spirosoma sp. KCTC 42546]|nr:hypothetical protein [Spirosoma sp. KCTC 42546]